MAREVRALQPLKYRPLRPDRPTRHTPGQRAAGRVTWTRASSSPCCGRRPAPPGAGAPSAAPARCGANGATRSTCACAASSQTCAPARPPLTRAQHGARARRGRRCGRGQGERPAVLNAGNNNGATEPRIFIPLHPSRAPERGRAHVHAVVHDDGERHGRARQAGRPPRRAAQGQHVRQRLPAPARHAHNALGAQLPGDQAAGRVQQPPGLQRVRALGRGADVDLEAPPRRRGPAVAPRGVGASRVGDSWGFMTYSRLITHRLLRLACYDHGCNPNPDPNSPLQELSARAHRRWSSWPSRYARSAAQPGRARSSMDVSRRPGATRVSTAPPSGSRTTGRPSACSPGCAAAPTAGSTLAQERVLGVIFLDVEAWAGR